MQPTLHDHVLECALYQQTISDGRVAILTDNRTLKIKALAEVMAFVVGLVSHLKEKSKPVYSTN